MSHSPDRVYHRVQLSPPIVFGEQTARVEAKPHWYNVDEPGINVPLVRHSDNGLVLLGGDPGRSRSAYYSACPPNMFMPELKPRNINPSGVIAAVCSF